MLVIAGCIGFYAIGKMPVVENSNGWNWISQRFREAAHTVIALCGVEVTLLFFDTARSVAVRRRFINALVFAALLFTAGYFLRPSYKISKVYATPTWSLYCAALCVVLFMFLYWLIDKKKVQGWTNFFKPAASNPLLTYIIPDIIYSLTGLLGIVIVPYFCRSGWPGMVWSAFFAVAVMGIVILLNKLKLRLQL